MFGNLYSIDGDSVIDAFNTAVFGYIRKFGTRPNVIYITPGYMNLFMSGIVNITIVEHIGVLPGKFVLAEVCDGRKCDEAELVS